MIVSSKALDTGVNLALTPVGSGPYKLVSSGPQGANYERNEDYYDKSQNQFAKAAVVPIVASARVRPDDRQEVRPSEDSRKHPRTVQGVAAAVPVRPGSGPPSRANRPAAARGR